jgi:pimeloyl-ACP methyl ester carboxylesterase
MKVIDMGSGPPLVLVPGVQGRWEWMRPGVEGLAGHYRVITFSLCDEPTSGARFDAREGFACYVAQVRAALDTAGVERAIVCGMSYGGLIATAFAAQYPQRTRALVLISALCPGWRTNARARFFLRAPRLLFPLFVLSSLRLLPEIIAAHDGLLPGAAAALRHGWNVVTHPPWPMRLARRVRLVDGMEPALAVTRLDLPTLIITGEDWLDRVVPPSHSRQYLQWWPHATCEVLGRTGHLGLITRPGDMVERLDRFVASLSAGPGGSGRARPADDTTPALAGTGGSARTALRTET